MTGFKTETLQTQAYSYLDVTAILKLWSHMIISEAGRADYQKLTKQATALTMKNALGQE